MALFGLAWDDLLSIAIALLAIIPCWIGIQAYRRTPTTRVLLFASAFALFLVKGLIIAAEVLIWEGSPTLDALELVADAVILVLFTVGMLKG